MQLNPYLSFNGNCADAFKLYEKVLGGKIIALMTYGGSPMESRMPAEWRDKIMHARLQIGEEILMGSDPPPENYEATKGMSVTINVDKPAEADRIFQALAENGKVQMPIQATFWADRFGMLVDRFGVPWLINCEKAAQMQQAS